MVCLPDLAVAASHGVRLDARAAVASIEAYPAAMHVPQLARSKNRRLQLTHG